MKSAIDATRCFRYEVSPKYSCNSKYNYFLQSAGAEYLELAIEWRTKLHNMAYFYLETMNN